MGVQVDSKKTFYKVEPKKGTNGVASSDLNLMVRGLCKAGELPVVDVDATGQMGLTT